LRVAGVDIAHVVVVGDRRDEVRTALSFVAGTGVDLIITSGGLGPTADDLTAEVVAEFQGRSLRLDVELERAIGAIIARLSASRGWRTDDAATAAATRKQALVPDGARVLPPVGTAPGLIVPVAEGRDGPPVLVLPGPPRELQGMWPAALDDPVIRAALAGREELRQRTVRLWGTPESQLAATLRDNAALLDGLEVTTCLRDGGELEIVTRFAPDAQPAYDQLHAVLTQVYADTVFSADGRTIDDIVADALIERNATIATAESCTAGLLAARLTERPGSSEYVLGGVVAYSNAVKEQALGVPAALIDSVGAVSAEVAEAMAHGARERLHADVGVGITGVAGPGGGTPTKPVGLVHLCVASGATSIARGVRLPGSRADVRHRSVSIAMHLLRELLTPSGKERTADGSPSRTHWRR
ncbi:MAG TPA: competence/damage-inducible protein A, partial [Jatrophihabitantaceae bacterium]